MANTTSGTYVFEKNFSIDEIIEESYERIGYTLASGYDLVSARRSLNILFQEWGNRGLHYWEVGNNSITLVKSNIALSYIFSINRGISSVNSTISLIFNSSSITIFLNVFFILLTIFRA